MKLHRVAFALILCLTVALRVLAQISPGKLSTAHKNIEGINNCTQCHVLGQEVADSKCLVCHTVIENRINQSKGYHSTAEVKTQKCATCHSEHHGLEYQLIYWKNGRSNFNHALADWPLVGAHAKTDCKSCHQESFVKAADIKFSNSTNQTRTFLGLSADCKSCHQDEHRGQLADNCLSCHSYEAWSPAEKFSHSQTSYPLTGKHSEVSCIKCHQSEIAPAVENSSLIQKKEHSGFFSKYKELKFSNCTPCHADVHNGKFSSNCKSCHTTEGFGKIIGSSFDHSKTNFPLVGKHIGVECTACHTSGTMTDPLAHQFCKDCHSDIHRGQFADREDKGACESCHTLNGFLPAAFSADNHNQTRYPLTGSHLAVPCFACHTQVKTDKSGSFAKFEFTDLTCKGCHADVHGRQLDKWIEQGGCEFCHSTPSWHQTKFNHSLTKFPLVGRHEKTICVACHVPDFLASGEIVLKMQGLKLDCNSCHEDPHHEQFLRSEQNETKTACERCHTAESWSKLAFVHNRDARFTLDGAHENLACIECHKSVTSSEKPYTKYKPLGIECVDCHGSK